MVLSEKKVWKLVNGEQPRPKTVKEHEAELEKNERAKLTDVGRRKIQKEVDEWDERDEEALRIISFTVSDQLQGPIHYGKTAKGAWDELMAVHAPNDKQRKFSLLRRLYRLDMASHSSLIDHERVFDDLMQNLAAIGKMIDSDELIILYANSLPAKTFGTWIQSQMAFIDKMTITEFKGRVREEARRLNTCGLNQELGVERDPDTVQANMAQGHNRPRIFPSRKPTYPKCGTCGWTNHLEQDCHKRIAEEYLAKQAAKAQNPKRGGRGGRGRGGYRGGHGNANYADANNDGGNNGTATAPAYNSIFGGLAYCLKAAINRNIQQVKGVWIKDNGATHHMHHDKSLFTNYHHLKHRLYVGGIGSGLKAVGIGDVEIKDPAGKSRILNGVLHVPALKCGLLSLNTLALVLGLNTMITKDGCVVSDGDFKIHSPIRNGLCVWGEGAPIDGGNDANALFASIAPRKVSLTDWHERLGHISKNTILKYGESAIEDLHLDPAECNDEEHQTPCESCVMGKHARTPFKPRTANERRKIPLELVHSDLAEANVQSLGGGKYALTFKDDATSHGTVFILANKNAATVLKAFKEYQAWAERQSGCKIKQIRVDRGTEYMGEMLEYIKSQGIEHNPTAGYSPQSNGVAERTNRTLFEMACTMLDSSRAPLELWGEAVLAACHIRNRLPSRTLGKTPHEAWSGKKPTIGHIRKWGCKVY